MPRPCLFNICSSIQFAWRDEMHEKNILSHLYIVTAIICCDLVKAEKKYCQWWYYHYLLLEHVVWSLLASSTRFCITSVTLLGGGSRENHELWNSSLKFLLNFFSIFDNFRAVRRAEWEKGTDCSAPSECFWAWKIPFLSFLSDGKFTKPCWYTPFSQERYLMTRNLSKTGGNRIPEHTQILLGQIMTEQGGTVLN